MVGRIKQEISSMRQSQSLAQIKCTISLAAELPRQHSGKESACQCREHGFNPWSGKSPLPVQQVSPCATTIESVLQGPCSTTREAATSLVVWDACIPLENSPAGHNQRKVHAATKTQHSQKINNFFKLKKMGRSTSKCCN